MPRHMRKKAPRRRRRGRKGLRRHRRHNARAVIDRMPGKGFADMVFCRLVYVDRIRISSIAAAYMQYVFMGNNVFDPDFTSVGHQPMYFDQYAAVYSKYRVSGCSIQLDVINDSGTSALQYIVNPSTDLSSATTISPIYEQSRSKAPKIVPIAARVSSRFRQYVSTRQVCGLPKMQEYTDSFSAAVTSAPANIWYWNILFESMDNLAVVDGYFTVRLIYYVQFYDRLIAAQS